MKVYFKNEDQYWAKDGESMHTMKVVPDYIIFLIGHPCGRHKQEEEDIQNREPNDQIEELN